MTITVEVLTWLDNAMAKHGPWFVISFAMFWLAGALIWWVGPRLDKVLDAHLKTLQDNHIQLTRHGKQISRVIRQQVRAHQKQLETHALTEKSHALLEKLSNHD